MERFFIYFFCFYSVKPLYFTCKANANHKLFHLIPSNNSTLRENSHKSLSESPSLQCQKPIMYVTWMKKDEDVMCQMNLFLKHMHASVNCFFLTKADDTLCIWNIFQPDSGILLNLEFSKKKNIYIYFFQDISI